MFEIHTSRVSLSFFGDDLDPAELTALLGVEPSFAAAKGTKRISSGKEIVAGKGSWRLQVPPSTPGNLSGQLNALLSQLTDDLAVWKQLTQRFQARVFCGVFMEASNEAFRLDPADIVAVGERGLFLDLDIYAPDSECDSDQA